MHHQTQVAETTGPRLCQAKEEVGSEIVVVQAEGVQLAERGEVAGADVDDIIEPIFLDAGQVQGVQGWGMPLHECGQEVGCEALQHLHTAQGEVLQAFGRQNQLLDQIHTPSRPKGSVSTSFTPWTLQSDYIKSINCKMGVTPSPLSHNHT